MIDYFTIYKCILRAISEKRITDAFQLFESLSKEKELFEMRKILPENIMVDITLEVLDNLIDDGLVIAKRYPTADCTLYQIHHLSTLGYSYLLALEKPNIKTKIKDFLKEEGLPLTVQNISKVIARLLW